jgi:DNA-binding HxlR family transcriptional regulator
MDSENLFDGTCPIARGLARVGDRWSMLILRDAGRGVSRFDQFRVNLGIAPNILTQRLKTLTLDGLLEKHRYSERPPRDEYVLTPAGRDFLPILLMIAEWGRRHNGAGKINRFINSATGKDLRPVLVDAVSGTLVSELPVKMIVPS